MYPISNAHQFCSSEFGTVSMAVKDNSLSKDVGLKKLYMTLPRGKRESKNYSYVMPGLHSRQTAWNETRTGVWRVHSSHLLHSRPVLVSSQCSRRHVCKSVLSHRKQECLALLSTILAWECECLHSCVLHLVHISPKVSTSTRDENENQA